MNIKQLHYFLGVLEARSFTKAAACLGVAQPALGLQVRNLEEEFGTQLLVRHSRGVTPTEAGALLAKHATALVHQFDRARQDIVDFGKASRGRVVLGVTTTTAIMLAATLVERCRRKYPGIALNLVEGLSERLMEWVDSGGLDIALTYNTTAAAAVVYEPLVNEALVFVSCVTPAGKRRRATITLAAALGHDLILPSRPHLLTVMIDNAARKIGRQLKIVTEIDSVPTIKELVLRGLGYTILPYGAVRPEVTGGRLLAQRLREPELWRTLHLAYSTKRPSSKAVEAVCAEIHAATCDLAAAGDAGWTLYRGRTRAANGR